MKTSYWLNEIFWNNDEKKGWVEVSKEEFYKAVSIAGFDKGFFAGSSVTSFETSNPNVKYKRGQIRN